MSAEDQTALDEEKVRKTTEKLIRDVAGILDANQRFILITEKLQKMSPPLLVEVLRMILDRATHHDPQYQDFFQNIVDIKRLARRVGMGKMSEVYTLARRKSYEEVIRYLQMMPPAKRVGEEEDIEQDAVMKDLSLGIKRSLARTKDQDTLNRLCQEQDPVVIELLLQNPRITIKEVVKIASKRPTGEHILWTIYRNKKWSSHYMVKMALINNPYTPPSISVSLLHFLMENDLVDVAENTILHSAVRRAAVQMIKSKRKYGNQS
ncbi:MAG: hypothetical protein R6V10_04220 [bacterium]